MPAHRVVAGLGALPEATVENLRVALRASRQGRAVVVPDHAPASKERPEILSTLRYLDAAVLLEFWRFWGLDSLLDDLLPSTTTAAAATSVVAAMVIQRAIDPGSKLFCQRWLPTTALPELLDMTLPQFNNTRIHRVLDQLHAITPRIQDRLPALYQEHGLPTFALFVDVTDTYFEGRGCELAQRHRTKAGHRNKYSLGIVLLVNDSGLPLRWHVVASKTAEHLAMGAMVREVSGLDWVGDLPFVFDRAMGRESTLRELLDSGVHFLTAVPVSSIESHTTSLPHASFSTLELRHTESSRAEDLARIREAARSVGMKEDDDCFFVLDLGVVDFGCSPAINRQGPAPAPSTRSGNLAAASIERDRELQARLDSGEFQSLRQLARAEGMSRSRVSQFLGLLRLPSDLLELILAAPPDFNVSEYLLRPLVKEKDPEKQRELFEVIVAANRRTARSSKAKPRSRRPAPNRLRLVAYFNPEMFLRQHQTARQHLEDIETFVRELNEELASAKRSRQEVHTRRKIERMLEKSNYLDAFDLSLEPIDLISRSAAPVRSFRCTLTLKPDEWERRQRYNGFVLLVSHPDLPHPGVRLARLFRAKDTVEKDFQTVKSVVKLRPIYHHTDPKVQAHVTLCMLALLLQRTLKDQLHQAKLGLSAEAALEILRTCHLNKVKQTSRSPSIYLKTNETIAQREILEALNLARLVDDEHIAAAVG